MINGYVQIVLNRYNNEGISKVNYGLYKFTI